MISTGLTVTEVGTGVGNRLASLHEERDLTFKKKYYLRPIKSEKPSRSNAVSQISDASELSGLPLSNENQTRCPEVLQGRSVDVLRALDSEAHVRLLKGSPVFTTNPQPSTAVAVPPNPDGVSAEGQPGRNTTPHWMTASSTAFLNLKKNNWACCLPSPYEA